MNNKLTSWNNVAEWYDSEVGNRGHFYHQNVILPNLLRILQMATNMRVLDVGCGQGVLGKQFDSKINYVGVDISPKLIKMAKDSDNFANHEYLVGDATKELKVAGKFDRIVLVLALQNMRQPFLVIKNLANKLTEKGQLIAVLNHPCFRIPQNSDWGYDAEKRAQFRKIFRYYQPLNVEIKTNPFKLSSGQTTTSFHYPISTYWEMFFDNGLVVTKMEEWLSPKTSTGGRAMAENKARAEIPLFLTLVAQKSSSVL